MVYTGPAAALLPSQVAACRDQALALVGDEENCHLFYRCDMLDTATPQVTHSHCSSVQCTTGRPKLGKIHVVFKMTTVTDVSETNADNNLIFYLCRIGYPDETNNF